MGKKVWRKAWPGILPCQAFFRSGQPAGAGSYGDSPKYWPRCGKKL